MSVTFVPEKYRRKAVINQETIQRVPADFTQKPCLFGHNSRFQSKYTDKKCLGELMQKRLGLILEILSGCLRTELT
ncbi:uncharacterized protein [Ambystoma mexicanum]|uniref:uncharacterized protein isoform X2 n=1 Tax=Ambystoma mexicanum TaxID=8296 RepID=UPI0037E7DCAC